MQQLNTGMSICGFTVKKERYIPEQEATLFELEHIKTGAELCFMDSKLDNKLFFAAFKTIPFDDTGVFHILEHSVLCGSELYPVREPFVELLKSSMQTFLNAMTFPDKTVYPCASRNEKDFLNLTKVYLDAVFAPRCVYNENVFLQEGWRHESDENGERFKGVVFNEMKGAMAGADGVMERAMGHLLFPDTCYGFNSGGDPKSIPGLTYASFKKSYATFYHPSNCRLYLDGNIPLEKTLTLLDSYLVRFERLTDLPEIKLQKPVSRREEVFYAINEEEKENGMSFFTMARIFSGWEEKEKNAAMLMLIDALTDSNSSPLKKAILDEELGEDVEVNLETGIAQSILSVTVRNTDKEKEEQIVRAWDGAVRRIMREGIDYKELAAELASLEYHFREPSEPRALYRGITALDSWLYGGDPALYLQYEDLLTALRKRLDRKGFEELLPEFLSEAEGMCRMWTLPSTAKAAEDEAAEQELLKKSAEKETTAEKEERVMKNKALAQWQNTPDTPEQLRTLPTLSLKDIPTDLYRFPTQTVRHRNVECILHNTATNGIIYANYYFKLTDFAVDKLAYINFLTALLTELPTGKYTDVLELQREIKTLTGNLGFSLRTDAKEGDTERCTPYFIARMSTVPRNAEKAIALLQDILLTTDLSDSKTIRSILLQEKENARQNIIMRGESAGIGLALVGCTAQNTVSASYNGLAYYKFLCDFAASFKKNLAELRGIAKTLQHESFCLNRVTLSLTAGELPAAETFLSGFPEGTGVGESIRPEKKENKKTGIKLPVPIGFATAGWYNRNGKASTKGSLSVAAKILSLNTLWNKIRVNGGAYGAGFAARRDNCFVCYSFRDPTPLSSVEIFKTMDKELVKWCDGPETPDKYIISTISEMEPLLSPASLAELEDARCLSGYTYEMRLKAREEILKTDKEALRKWAETFTLFGNEMNTCLVGGEQLIKESDRVVSDL